jgi:hypothetical protein
MKTLFRLWIEMEVGIYASNRSFQGQIERRIFVILQNTKFLMDSACDET